MGDVRAQEYLSMLQGSNLRTAIGTGPTVGMVLRLVTNEVFRISVVLTC